MTFLFIFSDIHVKFNNLFSYFMYIFFQLGVIVSRRGPEFSHSWISCMTYSLISVLFKLCTHYILLCTYRLYVLYILLIEAVDMNYNCFIGVYEHEWYECAVNNLLNRMFWYFTFTISCGTLCNGSSHIVHGRRRKFLKRGYIFLDSLCCLGRAIYFKSQFPILKLRVCSQEE